MHPDDRDKNPIQLLVTSVKGWVKLVLLLFGFLCFLAGGAWLYCLHQNEAGRKEWERVKAGLEAKGESLNWAEFLPVTIPDKENFVRAPIVENLFVRGGPVSDEKRQIKAMDATSLSRHLASIDEQKPADIEGMVGEIGVWSKKEGRSPAQTNSATRVTDWFDSLAPTYEIVLNASRRPKTQFAVDLSLNSTGMAADYVTIRQLAQQMAVLATVYLADEKPDHAMNCIRINMAMSRGLKDGPTLVSAMIGCAVENITMSVIWQGLIEGVWDDKQLEELDQILRTRNWVASIHLSMRTERVAINDLFDNVESPLNVFGWTYVANPIHAKWKRIFRKIAPEGWTYQARAIYCTTIQNFAVEFYDPINRRAHPSVLADWGRFTDSIRSSKHPRNRVIELVVPNFSRAFEVGAKLQARVDQARIAIALEQFRNKAGRYPESLDDLSQTSSDTLPHDLFGGDPYRYRLFPDERYRIWSVGWNEEDEDGLVSAERTEGDWVWFSFAKAAGSTEDGGNVSVD